MKSFKAALKESLSDNVEAPAVEVEAPVVETPMLAEPIKPKTLSEEVVNLLNQRIGDEYQAHYIYRAASDWCKGQGYMKAAAFFQEEAMDELGHAKILRDYLVDWNCTPMIPEGDHNPQITSLIDAINKAYEFEYKLLQNYVEVSAEIFSKDLATFDFLQQFRDIQTKSVAVFSDLLNAAILINPQSKFEVLYFHDQYFG
jgi:ferritin